MNECMYAINPAPAAARQNHGLTGAAAPAAAAPTLLLQRAARPRDSSVLSTQELRTLLFFFSLGHSAGSSTRLSTSSFVIVRSGGAP